MSRRKRHFRRYGKWEKAERRLPGARVASTGRRRYRGSAQPGVAGGTVTEPMGERKRGLVKEWTA